MKEINNKVVELSDEELGQVSGGGDLECRTVNPTDEPVGIPVIVVSGTNPKTE